MRAERAIAFAGVAALSAALAPASVGAHAGHVPLRAERTLKFEANGGEGLRMIVTENFGAEEMLRRARRADENGDGTVSQNEATTFLEEWMEDVRRELPVRVDGGHTRVDFHDAYFHPQGRIQIVPGTLEVVGTIAIHAGTHEVFVTDEAPADAFERTDVLFTAENGATLLATGPTELPTELLPSFAYGAGLERRRVTQIGLRLTMPEPPEGELPKRRPFGILRPALALATITVFNVILGRLLRAIRLRDRLKKH